MKRFLIIGYGKVGSHLHYALKAADKNFDIEIIKSERTQLSRNKLENADIIFICTQDDKIKFAVKKILSSRAVLNKKIIAHTSGSLTSDELSSLKSKKAYTASFHPVQTFEAKAHRNENRFKGIYIAIEGSEAAKKTLAGLCKKINSKPFFINKEFKIAHHICCVLSSGLIVSNIGFIRDIYRQKNGFKKLNFFGIYKPLIVQTLRNIESQGIEKSLTGPIIRDDIKTVQKHIRELKNLPPEILNYYSFLTLKSIKIAHDSGSIHLKEAKNLRKLFNKKS